MKQVNIICQAKGGVGKSFLTYLINEKTKIHEGVYFIDVDNANRTTVNRLPKERVKDFNVLDAQKKINREAFISLFENIARSKKQVFFVDLGATESIELLNMLQHNFEPLDLLGEFMEMGIDIKFFVVVSGGDVFTACIGFLDSLIQTVRKIFPVSIYVNLGRFTHLDSDFIEQIKLYSNPADMISVTHFGSTDNEESSKTLLEFIKNGITIDSEKLGLATKMKYRKLLNELEV